MTFHVPEKFRITTGNMGSTSEIGNAGAFDIQLPRSQRLFAIASDAFTTNSSAIPSKSRQTNRKASKQAI